MCDSLIVSARKKSSPIVRAGSVAWKYQLKWTYAKSILYLFDSKQFYFRRVLILRTGKWTPVAWTRDFRLQECGIDVCREISYADDISWLSNLNFFSQLCTVSTLIKTQITTKKTIRFMCVDCHSNKNFKLIEMCTKHQNTKRFSRCEYNSFGAIEFEFIWWTVTCQLKAICEAHTLFI